MSKQILPGFLLKNTYVPLKSGIIFQSLSYGYALSKCLVSLGFLYSWSISEVNRSALGHCCAIHLLDNGTDVRFIQELLGHKDMKTTMIYTYFPTKTLESIQIPIDHLSLGDNR